MVKKTDNPGIEEVRNYIRKILEAMKSKGIKEFEINAGTIVKELKIIQATPTVCSAMRSCGYEYEEIYSPPKGNGTRLTFKYKL
jgi:hypothetical protein